ncbi:GIY-YIG nuclease family protein [Rufibacter ruber]|uniref:GIY-YIG nuclease family protein n=1 Tax=Rufibacter ruber TaxID=1783499 RepID=UPI0009ECFF29|nr:GIY-YIG nuclease family protein [Rufibacter ruber]
MELILNDGYCPECLLQDEEVELLLNKDDFWECPKSNLQLAVFGTDAVTLKFRGTGKFKEETEFGTQNISGAALAHAKGANYYSDIVLFSSLDEFGAYLTNDIEPTLGLTLGNLAITYSSFKYGNPLAKERAEMSYKRQSRHFKIDFENLGITKKLEKRDLEEGMSDYNSYTLLYRLLITLFERYHKVDISWLPEMGMSLNQAGLCNKHLHSLPEPVTFINDPEFLRGRLLTFIVDLIEIIYRGKKVELPVQFVEPAYEEPSPSITATTLTLQDLLDLKSDLFKNAKVKMVRHKDNRREYRDLIKDKASLLEYQREQSKEVFKDCDFIISFVGQKGTKSLLFGIFKVKGVEKRETSFYYDLEQVGGFDYLVDRVVVDWGDNSIAWHQWYHKQPKEVVQILPNGYLGSFPGLLNFVLDFDELQKLTQNPEANQDWKSHLSAVNGIYLILDSQTGNQYVGSACGNEGIWQRWCNYAYNSHGNNKKLIELCSNPGYGRNFRFSILQTLPANLSKKEVVAIEYLYMRKLGTRAYGLN